MRLTPKRSAAAPSRAGRARKAFDLEQEKPETRDRYGRHTFGQSLLMARRLIEAINDALVVSSFDERHPATSHRTAGTPLGATDFDSITIGPRALARYDVEIPANLTAGTAFTTGGQGYSGRVGLAGGPLVGGVTVGYSRADASDASGCERARLTVAVDTLANRATS